MRFDSLKINYNNEKFRVHICHGDQSQKSLHLSGYQSDIDQPSRWGASELQILLTLSLWRPLFSQDFSHCNIPSYNPNCSHHFSRIRLFLINWIELARLKDRLSSLLVSGIVLIEARQSKSIMVYIFFFLELVY